MKKISLYQFFLLLVILSPFLAYIFKNGVIAYGPVVLAIVFISFCEFLKPSLMTYKEWIAAFIFVPYTVIASFYYVLNPYEGKILSEYFLTILLIPIYTFIFLLLIRHSSKEEYSKFICKIILFFLLGQLIICFGQISTYIFGFGLPVSQDYKFDFMVSGTYKNSNDLAVIILLISMCLVRLESFIKSNIKNIMWFIIVLLLIITSSRSALFLTFLVFIFTRKLGYKSIISSLLIVLSFGFLISVIFSQYESDVLNRIFTRLETFYNIYENGLRADSSISLRLDSYIHFFNNLKNLGLGSGEINNYYKFANNAYFESWLMFQNPHFLVIEIGYWLGWGGLLSFSIAFLFLIFTYHRSFLFLLIAIISMCISSSVLGSFIYFFFLILYIFSNLKNNIKEISVEK